MGKILTISSTRAFLILLFIISLVVFGDLRTVKAEEHLTVEGVWEVISVSPLNSSTQNILNKKVSIMRQGDNYEVKWLDGPLAGAPVAYSGSEKQIVKVYNDPIVDSGWIPGEQRGEPRPANLAQEVAGITYPNTVSYTLSADGNSIQKSWDAVNVFWENGHYSRYEVSPGFFKQTLNRVSGPTQLSSSAVKIAVSESLNKTSSPVAQVESRGEFYFLTKDGRKLTGEEASKLPLEEGSKVVTGSTGHIKMTLPDNTTFTVGPNSDLVIDKFVYDPAKDSRTITANLSKGIFRWVTGKTAQHDPAQMKVTLPVGTIGIRGTDFETTIQPDGSGSIVLYFGQLEITEKKTGFKFILEAGHKVTFSADGSFSRPMVAD